MKNKDKQQKHHKINNLDKITKKKKFTKSGSTVVKNSLLLKILKHLDEGIWLDDNPSKSSILYCKLKEAINYEEEYPHEETDNSDH